MRVVLLSFEAEVKAAAKACPTLAAALLIQLGCLRGAVLAYANHLEECWALLHLVEVAAKAVTAPASSALPSRGRSHSGLALQEQLAQVQHAAKAAEVQEEAAE